MDDHVFGPVPSRRLGRSLGVNNVPAKTCTYSCVYCQLGAAPQHIERRTFYRPEDIATVVKNTLASRHADDIDYITLVPDGEPTLDLQLDKTIRLLKLLGKPVAVITNGSLLWQKNVRMALMQADWVSIKIDAGSTAVWRRVNHPHPGLDYPRIQKGWQRFADSYEGTLTTETMLVNGVNDGAGELEAIAGHVAMLKPATVYLAVPTRPPAMSWVRPPGEKARAMAYTAFKQHGVAAKELTGYSPERFAAGDDPTAHVMAILAVHPMRKKELEQLLMDSNAGWNAVQELMDSGDIRAVDYQGQRFYVRALPGTRRGDSDG